MNAWKNVAVLAAALAVMTACAAGSREVKLSAGPSTPAAEGSVLFSVTKNGNTGIVLKVKYLPHPDKLTPPTSAYVVWTRANKDAAAQNIGMMKVDADLVGLFNAETPLHSFDLFVTAEASGEAQTPTGTSLLWTSYSR